MESLQQSLYWLSSTIAQTVAIGFGVLAFFIQTALQKRAEELRGRFANVSAYHSNARGSVGRAYGDVKDMSLSEDLNSLKEETKTLGEWFDNLSRLTSKSRHPEKEYLHEWDENYEETYSGMIQRIVKMGKDMPASTATEYGNVKKHCEELQACVDGFRPKWEAYAKLKNSTHKTAWWSAGTIGLALLILVVSTHLASYLACSHWGFSVVVFFILLAPAGWCIGKFAHLIMKSLDNLP